MAQTLDFGIGEASYPCRKLINFFLRLKVHKIDKAIVLFIRNVRLEVMYAPAFK